MAEHFKIPQSINADDEKLMNLADLFKAYGDVTRLRIMFRLSDGACYVTDLADDLGMTQSAISHQLKLLRQAGLVGAKRDGRNIIYSLADEHVSTIISQGWDHINE
ncbi:ArsR/SmtB family transcription factor [Butyrivibrio sp. TB]|uniref:ArsR/SmtB family transcription factor n=1 Tax=Butyrivibrio sp. TB TaxID=1520809 RepID=UPI0008ACDB59|nr:metalloregulator ArsR/SmtB family transcription factor [Butyrivibrio sp. TB]SEQ43836.1 DNA-binding transcriptional regulator, ArsR family [Butyrivibrio sp. TB]